MFGKSVNLILHEATVTTFKLGWILDSKCMVVSATHLALLLGFNFHK